MIDKALIKNIKFTSNILLEIKGFETKQIFYPNLKFFKILDIDGFTITGFYSETEKVRIKLTEPISNKEFQKKFVLQDFVDRRNIKNEGVKFNGKIFDRN